MAHPYQRKFRRGRFALITLVATGTLAFALPGSAAAEADDRPPATSLNLTPLTSEDSEPRSSSQYLLPPVTPYSGLGGRHITNSGNSQCITYPKTAFDTRFGGQQVTNACRGLINQKWQYVDHLIKAENGQCLEASGYNAGVVASLCNAAGVMESWYASMVNPTNSSDQRAYLFLSKQVSSQRWDAYCLYADSQANLRNGYCGYWDANTDAWRFDKSANSAYHWVGDGATADRYVGLGDSYASGLGAGNYWGETGTCYNSRDGYVELVNAELSRQGKPTFLHKTNATCAGAQTGFTAMSGWSPINQWATPGGGYWSSVVKEDGNPRVSRAPQQKMLWNSAYTNTGGFSNPFPKERTGLVSLSIGGNDMGFAAVAEECTMRDCKHMAAELTDPNRLATLGNRLKATYADIAANAPNARIRVINYPMAISTATALHCRTGLGGYVDLDELTLLEDVARLINQQIRMAVEATQREYGNRISVIDARSAFRGHEACTGLVGWMNGVHPTFLAESYHPSREGNIQLARLIADSL